MSILILIAIIGCGYPGPKGNRLICTIAPGSALLVSHAQRQRCFRWESPGFVYRKSVITVFMSIELMLNAVNLSFVAFSYELRRIDGHIYSFFVMVVAAAEAAVGLAIILTIFKNRGTLQIDEVDSMKL